MVDDWNKTCIRRIACNGDLSYSLLLSTINEFRVLCGTIPITLIISPEYLDLAYKIMLEMQVTKLAIVPVPGLPPHFWAVSGFDGLIYAGGL